MKPEDQRIAIAEATFFQRVDDYGSPAWRDKRNPQSCVLFTNRSGGFHLPEVTLETMHEAEKTLTTREQQADFMRELVQVLNRELRGTPRFIGPSTFDQSHAAAPHRAEAFLRTIGKWSENPA